MIIVTGGAGFIGSNIIAAFNRKGYSDILVVDNMLDGKKMHNLADLNIKDYIDKDDFLLFIEKGKKMAPVEAVFHQGACSVTTEWNGHFVMKNNYEYSKVLLHWCQKNNSQYIYASSASVYGHAENGFKEIRECEKPINMYAYSKFQFDQYLRSVSCNLKSQVVGLRYFNVYGPREAHKGSMASTVYHFNNQIKDIGRCKLFEGINGYLDGEQQRDFIFVEDCVNVNLWFFENPDKHGIYNLGTGKAQTFNEVANAVLYWYEKNTNVFAEKEYVEFPEHLKESYQSYTQADITALRNVGYMDVFHNVNEGVNKYLDWLNLSVNTSANTTSM